MFHVEPGASFISNVCSMDFVQVTNETPNASVTSQMLIKRHNREAEQDGFGM